MTEHLDATDFVFSGNDHIEFIDGAGNRITSLPAKLVAKHRATNVRNLGRVLAKDIKSGRLVRTKDPRVFIVKGSVNVEADEKRRQLENELREFVSIQQRSQSWWVR